MLWAILSANLKNSAVATGLEKVTFHFNPKEGQGQRIFKLPQNSTRLTREQRNAQNFPSQASAVCEPWISHVQAGFRKGRGTRDQIANIRWIIEKARDFQKNIYFCFIDYAKAFDSMDHDKLWKILKEMGISDHLTCLPRNLYSGQEATVRTGHGTMDWFKIGKGVCQACILSSCLFNFYAEYMMQNAGLDEAQAGIKIARRNINNLIGMRMIPLWWQKVKRN